MGSGFQSVVRGLPSVDLGCGMWDFGLPGRQLKMRSLCGMISVFPRKPPLPDGRGRGEGEDINNSAHDDQFNGLPGRVGWPSEPVVLPRKQGGGQRAKHREQGTDG